MYCSVTIPMPHENPQRLLRKSKTIAVVGCSTQPGKAAHDVPRYLQANGYRIIPVHPSAHEILGEQAYPSLAAIPLPVDLVNVFRPSDEAPDVVDAAIAKRVRAVWLQQGISHPAAAARARGAGLAVVMDSCIMQVHRRMGQGSANGSRSLAKRITILIVGWLFIVLGVVGLVLPFLQGVLFLLIGLAILSKESAIAHRWLVAFTTRHPKIDKQRRRATAWFRAQRARFRKSARPVLK